MVTHTNHAQNIIEKLKSVIKTEFPQFARPGKLIFRDRPLAKDFGHEEFLRIALISENFESAQTSGGTDYYIFEVYYYRKIEPEIKYESITDFAEHLWALLDENRAAATYWHNCQVVSIDYSEIPLPEIEDPKYSIRNYYGFTARLQISKGKYQ